MSGTLGRIAWIRWAAVVVAVASMNRATAAQTPSIDDTPAESTTPAASAPAGHRGALIPITGAISDVTTESLKRRIEQALADNVEVIIFEINTPGGQVTSAIDICDYIKNLSSARTVAWIHTQAYSAGSMISAACDEIVMAAASTIGDCGVILGLPTGPQAVPDELRAKAESPVLEQFRDSARRNHYNQLLCESLVIKERQVWWIENVDTGEREFVGDEVKQQRLGEAESASGSLGINWKKLAGQTGVKWKLVKTYHDPVSDNDVEVVQPVVADTELLTMSQSRAYAFGFSKGIVRNLDDLADRYGLSDLPRKLDFTWSEVLVRWMTSMPVRGFLLLLVLLGAYVEFNTPGVGVPGMAALICLAVFLGAPYLTGLANVWEIVVVGVGVLLLCVEIFVIPGFGIAGISGIVLVFIGLLATFVPEEPGRVFPIYWPKVEQGIEGLKVGLATLCSALLGAIVGMVVLSRYLPQMPYVRRLIPANPAPADVMTEDPYHGAARVGDVGRVESALRPAGKARFADTLVDVVSEGDFLDRDRLVEVIERHGNRVVVRSIANA